jgi:putative FmdB family regulatory protein
VPTYQYRCTDCGEPLEAVQSFTDDPLTMCPVCGGRLRKVFSSVGVVFKGSGFYRTDSRAGGKDGAGKSDKAETAAAAKSETKSESKSESKSDSKSGATAGTGSDTKSGTTSGAGKPDSGSSTAKSSDTSSAA